MVQVQKTNANATANPQFTTLLQQIQSDPQNPQVSTSLMHLLNQPLDFTGLHQFPLTAKQTLQGWLNLKDLCLALGEDEHSGDWDCYLSITKMDGTEIEQPMGYTESKIEGDNLLIYTGDENDDCEIENLHWEPIPIKDIKTIQCLDEH